MSTRGRRGAPIAALLVAAAIVGGVGFASLRGAFDAAADGATPRPGSSHSRSSHPASQPLPARAWLTCDAAAAPETVVQQLPGPVYLECGDDRFGWRHIVSRHQADWQEVAAVTGRDWRSVADAAIEQVLRAPQAVVPRASNDTNCYSRVIELVDARTGAAAGSTVVRVVAGVSDHTLVTAFPATSGCR